MSDYAVSVGTVLANDMQTMGITQTTLANEIGVSKSVINEIIKGKRKMSNDVAIKLEPIFGVPAKYWLNIQSEYEIISRKANMFLLQEDSVIETGSYHAMDVAHWFINRAAKDAEITGEFITNLKLQKLLFLLQSRSIKQRNKAVFTEPIMHWEYGPVVENVYAAYKRYVANPIKSAPQVTFDEATEKLLETIYKNYEGYSASGLVGITHQSKAWLNTSQGEEMTILMISQD